MSYNFVLWPEDWPVYKQACYSSWDDRCDALVGPWRCGAWHQSGEFTLSDGQLHRYGKIVEYMWEIYASDDNSYLDLGI